MLDEVPKRIQAIQWIKVVLEHIVDEAGRPVVVIHVACVYPSRDDPSSREFDGWVIETFPTEIWEQGAVVPTPQSGDVFHFLTMLPSNCGASWCKLVNIRRTIERDRSLFACRPVFSFAVNL